MKESQALVRVQQIDLELLRHKRTLRAMPQTKKIKTIAAARKKLASELSKIVGQRKDAQMELQDNEESTARLHQIVDEIQAKYDSGTVGYREVADLQNQLTSLVKNIEKREFQHRELSARLEKTLAAERNARAMDERLVEEAQAQTQSLREQTAQIEHDVRMLTTERAEVVKSISDDVLARYEDAFKRFGGLAVETLRGNTPSVCRVVIPPSSFGDIRRGPSITSCPYCHRLMVTDGMFDLDA